MKKRALTAAAIERLKAPEKGQAEHFDAGYAGLAVRISSGGAKSFIYMYRVHGKQRRVTLGRYPAMTLAEARETWRAHRKAIDAGEDPAAKKPSNEFGAVAKEWLARDQADKRSRAEVERVLNHDILPAWRGRLIGDLKRRDCLNLIDAVADRGAMTMARQVHARLNRLFNWAVARGIIEASPMAGLPKPGSAVERDRVLNDDELAQVWRAAGELGYPFSPVVRLMILTGARRDEIGGLRLSEVHPGELILEQTKTIKAHRIPLSAAAQSILDESPRIEGCEFCFSTTGRTPVSGWSKAKTHIDRRLPDDFPAWRFHDLRRTAATGMQRLGVSLQVVEAVLGHVSGSRGGIVGIYQRHEFADEKRRALNMWAAHVQSLQDDATAKIYSIA